MKEKNDKAGIDLGERASAGLVANMFTGGVV